MLRVKFNLIGENVHANCNVNLSLFSDSERWKGSNMCADWLAKNCLSMELGESNVCGLASEDLSVHGA